MAGIAIPLIAGVVPSIIQLIASLTHPAAQAAEVNLGPGTGPVKLSAVFDSVMGALTMASANGTIQGPIPDSKTVLAIIQAVVSSMHLSGLLGGIPAAPLASVPPASTPASTPQVDPSQTFVTLGPGTVITFMIK